MAALSTADAAALAGLTPSAFRVAMTRARRAGLDLRVPGPDARTPLWDADGVRTWLTTRPGKGRR